MTDERLPIPEAVKRQVRQRCGFGCVVCGMPLYEIDHLVPYAEVQEHDPDNLVLLCDRNHREKTQGLLPVDEVAAASSDPINLRVGHSDPYPPTTPEHTRPQFSAPTSSRFPGWAGTRSLR